MIRVRATTRNPAPDLECEPRLGINLLHGRLDPFRDECLHAIDLAEEVVSRNRAPLHDEFGALRDDVQYGAALDGSDMDRRVRRIEPLLERPLGREPPGLRGDPGDCFGGGVEPR